MCARSIVMSTIISLYRFVSLNVTRDKFPDRLTVTISRKNDYLKKHVVISIALKATKSDRWLWQATFTLVRRQQNMWLQNVIPFTKTYWMLQCHSYLEDRVTESGASTACSSTWRLLQACLYIRHRYGLIKSFHYPSATGVLLP